MKPFFIILSCFLLASCISPAINLNQQTKKKLLILEQRPVTDEFVIYEILSLQVADLSKYIGGYPPTFKNNKARQTIYQKWLNIIANAEHYAETTENKESAFYILAELYRLGFNMDVLGSVEKAQQNLKACLKTFPKSKQCHLSASFLYLAIGEPYLDKAEQNLAFLRHTFLPKTNSDTEAGYIFLYLLRSEKQNALKQLNLFIKSFPKHPRTPTFQKLKNKLESNHSNIIKVTL